MEKTVEKIINLLKDESLDFQDQLDILTIARGKILHLKSLHELNTEGASDEQGIDQDAQKQSNTCQHLPIPPAGECQN